jgi:DNA-binding transcriptional MerR regulator
VSPQPDRQLLSIGRFARLTGLSIGALRHYDELGLLTPTRVDPQSGYRSYRREQADAARLIRRLRELGLSLPQVAAISRADAAERQRLLAAHRQRLAAQLSRLQRAMHHLNRIVDHEEPIMTTPSATAEIDRQARRQLAADLFNHAWTLIEAGERTPEQDDEMIHAAHASRYHWGEVGEATNLAIGEWQCSRVYATLGRAEPALWHARRSHATCEANGLGDFVLAYAHEALARANRLAGDHESAERELALAREAGARIAEADDRELFESDLATLED